MDALLPLTTFLFVASITPGPNNLMLAASGAGFGFRRTVPHMLGVSAGFALLLLACGLGIGALLTRNAAAATAIKLAGTAYLLYLAWMLRGRRPLGGGGPSEGGDAHARPMSFLGALAFQFANPKAWLMGVTGASMFLPDLGGGLAALGLLCLVGCAVNLPCITTWAMLGSAIRGMLRDNRWQRRVSGTMVALTLYAATAIWI